MFLSEAELGWDLEVSNPTACLSDEETETQGGDMTSPSACSFSVNSMSLEFQINAFPILKNHTHL